MASVRVVSLIEVTETRGRGTHDDPFRRVREWFTMEGEPVVEEFDEYRPPLAMEER